MFFRRAAIFGKDVHGGGGSGEYSLCLTINFAQGTVSKELGDSIGGKGVSGDGIFERYGKELNKLVTLDLIFLCSDVVDFQQHRMI